MLDLCYVSCGRLDAAYAGIAGEGWKPWDYAAGSLMVSEAGGIMSTIDGLQPFRVDSSSVLATATPELCLELQQTFQDTLEALKATL